MDGIGRDGRLRHVVPTHIAMRIFLVVCGLFALIVSSIELWRGVWPISLFSLPFAIIIVGAFSVGVPMILCGLFAPTMRWTVAPQRIEVALANPFRNWRDSFEPGGVASFEIVESDGDGGPPTFRVMMRTVAGKPYHSRDYGSREAAERLLRDIERIFYGREA